MARRNGSATPRGRFNDHLGTRRGWQSGEGLYCREQDDAGLKAEKVENKMALRVVQNALITLDNCRVPEENCLQTDSSFRDTASVLRILTPDLEKKIANGTLATAGNRLIEQLERERDTMLMELLATRSKSENKRWSMSIRLAGLRDSIPNGRRWLQAGATVLFGSFMIA
jgi:hypothetical protein